MKRTELVRRISGECSAQGFPWVQLPSTGKHDKFECGGLRVAIPRHNEINAFTAEGIFRRLEAKLGVDWWRR